MYVKKFFNGSGKFHGIEKKLIGGLFVVSAVGVQSVDQQGLPGLVDFALFELLFGVMMQASRRSIGSTYCLKIV